MMHSAKRRALCRAVAALAALTLAVGSAAAMAGCSPPKNDTDGGDLVTREPVTLPDMTDDRYDREPTSVDPYVARLDEAFATTPATPTSDLTYTAEGGTVTVTGYTGSEVVVVIPDTLDGLPVTAIGEGAFAGMDNLRAVSLPDSVQTVGFGAFAGCSAMTTLRTPVYVVDAERAYFGALFGATSCAANGSAVPRGLTALILTGGNTIPDYAFYGCTSLVAVALPDCLTGIGDFGFYGCESLTYLDMRDAPVASVGSWAFTNCKALLQLHLPATVTDMGFAMLEGCGALENLTVPFVGGSVSENRYLGYLFGASDYTFTEGYLPASLLRVSIAEGCTEIPDNAFFGCSSVREIVLPESVTSVGRRAFYGCEWITAVTLPDSVTSIGDDAYNGCIRLASFEGGAGLTTLGIQAFMDCVSLADVSLPDSVTHLPNACFWGCVSLESLVAPGVTSRGEQVFRHCDQLGGAFAETETN